MLAKMGEKKTETKKARPVVIAVMPVLPPSAIPRRPFQHRYCETEWGKDYVPEIPVALSMNAVTGLVPMSAPIEIENASTQYATVLRSKSMVMGSRNPANLAIEYRVPVVSRMST